MWRSVRGERGQKEEGGIREVEEDGAAVAYWSSCDHLNAGQSISPSGFAPGKARSFWPVFRSQTMSATLWSLSGDQVTR